MDDVLKDIYKHYFSGNEKEFILLLNCVGKYGLSSVDKAISCLKETCPSNISVDKIEFVCYRNDNSKLVYLADYKDEITANSVNMMNQFNDLLND